jgi:hypothetical protein
MARNLVAIAIWLLLTAGAHSSCTSQTVTGLQERGVTAPVIAKMCGETPAAGTAEQTSNVCATRLGVCAYHGPIDSGCSCPSPNGPVPGTGR